MSIDDQKKTAVSSGDDLPPATGLFDRIIQFSIRNAIWVMLFVIAWIAVGIYSYQKLPIDAVPDITNVQVQVNSQANGFTALEVEQRITYPIETAMAGIPNLEQTQVRRIEKNAVQRVDEKDIVFVPSQHGDKIEFSTQPVQLGSVSSDGKWIEILSGLNLGQTYVSQGSFLLKSELEKGEAYHEH